MCSPYIWSPLEVATPRVFSPPGLLRIIEGMISILKKVNPIFLRAAMRAAYTLGSLLSQYRSRVRRYFDTDGNSDPKGNPHLLAGGHAGGIHFGIAAFRRIAITANATAVLGADQPPGRHAVYLPRSAE